MFLCTNFQPCQAPLARGTAARSNHIPLRFAAYAGLPLKCTTLSLATILSRFGRPQHHMSLLWVPGPGRFSRGPDLLERFAQTSLWLHEPVASSEVCPSRSGQITPAILHANEMCSKMRIRDFDLWARVPTISMCRVSSQGVMLQDAPDVIAGARRALCAAGDCSSLGRLGRRASWHPSWQHPRRHAQWPGTRTGAVKTATGGSCPGRY